jgi:SAM-dependent methyltransferase
MLSRKAKATFYTVAGPLMKVNGFLYRHFRAKTNSFPRVHLGPGQQNYLDGWVNVDANMFTGKCDVWADLRNPLPFHDASVDCFYSHHVVEHLPDLRSHVTELFRCLRAGGVCRIAGPNGDSAISKFMANDAAWFYDFPDSRSSIGGRFENFVFCRGEHLTILTFSYLAELLGAAGFEKITLKPPVVDTDYPERFASCLTKEHESDFETTHTLVVEAMKPL